MKNYSIVKNEMDIYHCNYLITLYLKGKLFKT